MHKPKSMTGGSFPKASAKDDVLDEFDMVRLRRTISRPGGNVPKDAVGTIVGVWRKGELYEVEFLDPAAVLTVPALSLARRDNAS